MIKVICQRSLIKQRAGAWKEQARTSITTPQVPGPTIFSLGTRNNQNKKSV